MAMQTVATPDPVTRPFGVEAIDDVEERVSEAIAILEMGWRVPHENAEDFKMLQRACYATMRILEEAQGSLKSART